MSLANNLKAYMITNLTRKDCEYVGARNRNEAIRNVLDFHYGENPGRGRVWMGSDKIKCSRPLPGMEGKLRPLKRGGGNAHNMITARDAGYLVREGNQYICFRKPEHAGKYLERIPLHR